MGSPERPRRTDRRSHGRVLCRAPGARRGLLVRLRRSRLARRRLRLDDGQLPGVRVHALPPQPAPQRVPLAGGHGCVRGARIRARVLHLASASAGAAAAARGGDRPVLDELHRAHLLVGRPAPKPWPDRPARRDAPPHRQPHQHPLHADGDRDRDHLLLPPADDPADLRLARAYRRIDLQRSG